MDNEIFPVGFTVYRNDRSSRGGGVLVAVKDKIPSHRIPTPPSLEVIAVELGYPCNVTLCTVYVPPSSSSEYHNILHDFMAFLCSKDRQLVFIGDFNYPDICWPTLTASSESSNLFCDLVFRYNLTQQVECPTHNRGNTLDLIIAKDEVVSNIVVHSEANSLQSDHYSLTFSVSVCKELECGRKSKLVFDYQKADWVGLCDYLLDSDLESCYEFDDVELIWATIKLTIIPAMDIFIPKVWLKKHEHPHWFTPGLRHLANTVGTLRRKCDKKSTTTMQAKLSKVEVLYNDAAKHVKAEYERSLINKLAKNGSGLYKYIGFLRKGGSIPPIMSFETELASNDQEKATLFNTYFHSVFTTSSFKLPPDDLMPTAVRECADLLITEQVLASLDPSKAMGLDGLGPRLLKFCALALYKPLHHLFVTSLQKHVIPKEWKLHSISPIYKAGDRHLIKNYRPISLLSTTSKVLERLVYNKCYDFLESSLSHAQFGFRKSHSTVQQLLLFYQHVFEPGNTSSQCDVIFLDFAKAFDSVPHQELLFKLRKLGVTGDIWLWLEEYLSERMQCVCIGYSRSQLLPVVSGVPQGSILGPLLFLSYINDLPEVIAHSFFLMFADDAKCMKIITGKEDAVLLQEDLDSLCEWSVEWKLKFKESKCALMKLCRYEVHSSEYNMNSSKISIETMHRDLGVVISADKTWNGHIDHIVARAYKVLGVLRRAFSNTESAEVKRTLYLTLVRSQLIYCSQIWRPHLITDIKKLEQVQRRATKFILNDYVLSYRERLIQLEMLPLMYTLEMNDILFFVKNLKQNPHHFKILDYVQFCDRNTRSGTFGKLKVPFCSTNVSKHFYFNRLPTLWNSLRTPDITKSVESIKQELELQLKHHFMKEFDSFIPCTFHYMCPCAKSMKSPRLPTF